jgi:hypothetical protein
MRFFIKLIFLFIFTKWAYASSISGTYYGENCGKKCNSDNLIEDPFEIANLIGSIIGFGDRNASFFIDQISDSSLSILYLDKKILFSEVTYNKARRSFKGLNDKQTINGSFNGNLLTIKIKEIRSNDNVGSGERLFLVKRLAQSEKAFVLLAETTNNLESLKKLTDKLEVKLQSTELRYINETASLEEEIKDLKRKLSQPPKINVTLFEPTSTVAAKVDLLTAPSNEKGKKLLTLNEGDLINHLTTIPPERDWSLVTNSKGVFGYIKNIFIIDNASVNNTSIASEPSINDGDKINILEPLWDKGKRNSQITLNAPGIVSLQGVVNIENLSAVYLNDEMVDVSNGRFNHAIIVTEGKNNVVVSAENTSGKRTELQFIILVN